MKILAIDPGSTESGFAAWDGLEILIFGKCDNDKLLSWWDGLGKVDHVVIEQVRSYGMPVGANVFDTVHWSGRFHQNADSYGIPVTLVPRIDVKMHLCHNATAKDSNVSQALRDRFAYGVRNYGKGTKKDPGFFYGFSKDAWQAFALAVTFWDKDKLK